MTHAVRAFATVQIETHLTSDDVQHGLICAEVPMDTEGLSSKIYVFNRIDGRLHSYNTFGGVRDEAQGEVWELVAEESNSIYDL